MRQNFADYDRAPVFTHTKPNIQREVSANISGPFETVNVNGFAPQGYMLNRQTDVSAWFSVRSRRRTDKLDREFISINRFPLLSLEQNVGESRIPGQQ